MDFLFLGLSGAGWFVIFVVMLVFLLQLCTKLPSDFVFLGGMMLLLLSGVIPASHVLNSFSSTTVILIGALFVVICGLVQTGFLQWVVKNCLGTPKSYRMAIVRLMLPVAALSSFLNNTTVVALFTKVVGIWAKKLNIAPSKLLIPLSYASGMGGICTLIGTPPNLIISALYADETGVMMGVFTTTIAGLFCLIVGVLSVVALSGLIPVRVPPEDKSIELEENNEELYKPNKKTLYSSLILIAMVVVSALGYLTLLQSAFLAAFAMIACRFCTIDQARSSIDWSLLMIFAGSISLGTAIQETGIAEWISHGIMTVCRNDPFWALFGICLASTFITEFTSNTATAAICFPIAYQTAISLNVNPMTFCIALMISVSSSFATPIGSPTHMIVYGPGGYRFGDFAPIGLLMNFIILFANLFITLLLFPL